MALGTKRPAGITTRAAILDTAVSLATVDGLEGLSIGTLAGALDMSKSGLYAHFGSKEQLQLATVEEAARIFRSEIIDPAQEEALGVPRLVALCDAFFDHLERRRFPGGCFFAGATLEMSARPGPVRERLADFQGFLVARIRDLVAEAMELGQLAEGEDPDELSFELNGIILAANASFVLSPDGGTLALARRVVRRRLGVLDRS